MARRHDTAGPLAVATPTTRKLADASISVNTRRAYLGALARVDAWRGDDPLTDGVLAAYLGAIFEAGRAPATAALAVAAVRFRAKLAGQPDPAGERTARVLGGYRRTAADRGRGQAAPLSADGLAAILATAERPRTDGRGVESHTTAQRRGRTDAVIAGLLFMGGLRRSEVSALEWRDVTDASDGDGVLITVRTSKTNQEGDTADVRYLKNGAAKAIRTVRAASPDGAQWPGRARVRTDGARRLNNRSHAGRELAHGAHGRSLQRGCHGRTRSGRQVSVKTRVSSFVRAGSEGGRHDINTTSKQRHSGINATGSPRAQGNIPLTNWRNNG